MTNYSLTWNKCHLGAVLSYEPETKQKYFKNSIEKLTDLFAQCAAVNIDRRGSVLQNSLLPESTVRCGMQEFYQYKGLVEPDSRQEAQEHLMALLEGVYSALKELHNPPSRTCPP